MELDFRGGHLLNGNSTSWRENKGKTLEASSGVEETMEGMEAEGTNKE